MSEELTWKYEKFKGNMCIYAICPACNFVHGAGEKNFSTGELEISEEYIFCPMCGTFLHSNKEKPCIYNVRDITELYHMELNIDVIKTKMNKQIKGE